MKSSSHLLDHQNKAKKRLFNVNKEGRKKFIGRTGRLKYRLYCIDLAIAWST